MTTMTIPKKPGERRVWIKGQLELRGESFASIARALGKSRQAVRSALDRPYPKMQQAIAERLNIPPEKLWPERY